jgi:transcription elongation factor, greA/greB, C-term
MQEKIKLNKQGYYEYLKAIEEKEKELAFVRMYKGTDAIYQGDNWHDNPTLYQTEAQERSLMIEISEMKHKLQNIEIVESMNNESLIDIGDIVRVDIIFDEDDREEETFKLIATTPSFNAKVKEVSINSPIGAAVYHKKVGDFATYKVKDNTFKLEILEKQNVELEQKNKTLKKTR